MIFSRIKNWLVKTNESRSNTTSNISLQEECEKIKYERNELKEKLEWLKSLNIPFAEIERYSQFDWINFVEDQNKKLRKQVDFLLNQLEKRDKTIKQLRELEDLYLSEIKRLKEKITYYELFISSDKVQERLSSFKEEDNLTTNIVNNVTECKGNIRKNSEDISSDDNQPNKRPQTLKELREILNQIDLRT